MVRVSAEVQDTRHTGKRLRPGPGSDAAAVGLGAEHDQVLVGVRGHFGEKSSHVVGQIIHVSLQVVLLSMK